MTRDHVRESLPRICSRELVDAVFAQPYCRIGNIVEGNIAGRQAAGRYLNAMTKIGVLEAVQVGRDKLFLHPRLMQLLTTDDNVIAGYWRARRNFARRRRKPAISELAGIGGAPHFSHPPV